MGAGFLVFFVVKFCTREIRAFGLSNNATIGGVVSMKAK